MINIKQWIGKGLNGLVDGSPNLNVINILRSLIEDNDSVVYIPTSYETERITTTDPRIHFNPIEAGKSIKVTNIISNKERFNFSLTGEVDVHVEYENEFGIELKPKKIFRTYSIIRDGELTMNYIVAKLSKEAFDNLKNANVLWYNGVQVQNNHQYIESFIYKIKLTEIPIISLAWAQPTHIGLYDNLMREEILANTLKEVNKIIKLQKEAGETVKTFEDSEYYNEGYFGETKVKSNKIVNCMFYKLGIKIIDTDDILIDTAKEDINKATRIKRNLTKELTSLRFINRCVQYAIELSKYKGSYDWSEKILIPRSKEKYKQTCSVEHEAYTNKQLILERYEYTQEI